MTLPVFHPLEIGPWSVRVKYMKREEVGCCPDSSGWWMGFESTRPWEFLDAWWRASSAVWAAVLQVGPALVRRAHQSEAVLCSLASWREGRLRESPSLKWTCGVEFRVPRNDPRPLFFTGEAQVWLGLVWKVCLSQRVASAVEVRFPGVYVSEASSQWGAWSTHTPCVPSPSSALVMLSRAEGVFTGGESARSTFHVFKERSL